MEDKEIVLDIQLTEADYISFLKTGLKARGMYRSMWLFGTYAVVIGLLSFVGGFSIGGLIPLLVFLLLLFAVFYELRVKAKNNFRHDPTLNKPYQLSMSEEEILVSRPESHLRVLWRDIFDCMITDKSVLIYISPVKVIIIPERSIRTVEQISEISELLDKKVVRRPQPAINKVVARLRWIVLIIIVMYFLFAFYQLTWATP